MESEGKGRREEGGGVAFVEVGDVAAEGGAEADGGVVAGVDVAAEKVAGLGAEDGLGELGRAAGIAAAHDDVDATARDARRGMGEQDVDPLRDLRVFLAEAVGREHEGPVEEDRRPRCPPEADSVDFAAAVDQYADVRAEAPVGGRAGGVEEEPVVVARHEDDGLLLRVDPRERVHRSALDVAADADGVGLVDDRLRGGRRNVAVEVGEDGEIHVTCRAGGGSAAPAGRRSVVRIGTWKGIEIVGRF